MKVFINPGHGTNDPGACGFGLKEAEVAAKIGAILERKLNAAGIETKNLQTDEFGSIPVIANEWGADLFVSENTKGGRGVCWKVNWQRKSSDFWATRQTDWSE